MIEIVFVVVVVVDLNDDGNVDDDVDNLNLIHETV